MGYLKDKYSKEYFLRENGKGEFLSFGVEGIEEFQSGDIREIDRDILIRIKYENLNIIDFGFGRGEALKFASENGAKKLTGVDFSQDAFDIARDYFTHYGIKVDMHCQDALVFIKDYLAKEKHEKFDVVIMLDFVEHVPRRELKEFLEFLVQAMSSRSILAINTPVYNADNDVIVEGLKPEAKEIGDDIGETSRLHCNRYTKESLADFMAECGYEPISGHFFIPAQSQIKLTLNHKSNWQEVYEAGYPVCMPWREEKFEYALPKPKKVSRLQIIRDYCITVGKLLLPPVIRIALSRIVFKNIPKNYIYKPGWHLIKGGNLRGRKFYIDLYDGQWQRDIVEGRHMQVIYKYLKNFDLEGKVIFDIGAHIGYCSLNFAEIVGKNGKVYAMEPNTHNVERMKLILSENTDLMKRIKVFDVALSDCTGENNFCFSPEIDNGNSRYGFISGVHSFGCQAEYKTFNQVQIKTITLDEIPNQLGIEEMPDFINIDVNGSEEYVLHGGINIIKKHKPVIFAKIYNAYNMFKTYEFLSSVSYRVELLEKEKEGCCLVLATPL
jgi:FkbM family methyltransferase